MHTLKVSSAMAFWDKHNIFFVAASFSGDAFGGVTGPQSDSVKQARRGLPKVTTASTAASLPQSCATAAAIALTKADTYLWKVWDFCHSDVMDHGFG